MKKSLLIVIAFIFASASFAQELKFGHVNMQEIVYLMDEMDSARVVLEKYNQDIQDTYNSMVSEFQRKYTEYQQMAANWSPAVLEAKQKELQDIEVRIQEYQQSAQVDMQNKQQEIFAPIQMKANEAVQKVGRTNGLVYIFDISMGTIPFVNETLSIDVTPMVKAELNISPSKKLPAPQGM